MNPKPFTYEHFKGALRSLKDDMLMCYIDEAVGIYCTLKGIAVGARPSSPGEYSQQYADAFEAANYAIYVIATKIDSYNPEKGAFKKYLDRALSNTLKDIMEADGRGDFFDQTSKKTAKDAEPEKHSRVNVDSRWGEGGADREPDDESARTRERVRQHKDEAFETMIRFIDSLPVMKREAVYASAFGQILRPELPQYGKGYAEIVAKAWNTTALYIRQLAAEGKKAALAEARRMGFSEQSMGEVLIGMVQTKRIPSPEEALFEAAGKLSGYQQFMMLRYIADKVDERDVLPAIS